MADMSAEAAVKNGGAVEKTKLHWDEECKDGAADSKVDIFEKNAAGDDGKDAGETGRLNPVDDDMELPTPPPVAPDGGWGWVVVVASFFSNMIVDGVCYTFGIFYGELLVQFGESAGKTALVGSLLAGMYLIIGPVASALANQFGCRIVAIVGSLISATFFFISSYSTNLNMMLVTYGIFGGIGFGLMYLPSIVMVGYYFDRKRALATGIAVCGTGIGTFIFAPLGTYLNDTFSWRGANIIMAGIILNGLVCGLIYRPLFTPSKESSPKRVDKLKPSAVIQTQVEEKRRRQRHYTVDSPDAPDGNDESSAAIIPPADDTVHLEPATGRSKISLNGSRKSVHLVSSKGDVNGGVRSRHASKISHSSAEERRIMDRQDALYTGSLARVPEFKEAHGDLDAYVSQMSLSTMPPVPSNGETGETGTKRVFAVISKMFDFSLLRSPTFILVVLSGIFLFAGLYTPFVFLADKAIKELGVEKTHASLILSVLGVTNTVTRVLVGLIADHPRVDCMVLHNGAAMLAGVVTCLVSVFNSYGLLMTYAALFGIFMAGFITLRSIVIVELLGISKLTSAFGLLTLFQGIAILFGSPLAGAIQTATNSYVWPFIISGVLFILGGAVCIPARRVSEWEKRRRHPLTTSPSVDTRA